MRNAGARRSVETLVKRRWRRRLGLFGLGLAAAVAAVYWYVPIEIEWVPRPLPDEKPSRLDIAQAFPKGIRVTLVTAHPDDAEFYLGATLPQLHAVGAVLSLVVATDGDKGYYPFEDAEENRRVRDAEQRAAAARWGATDVTFLHLPDGRLHSGEPLEGLIREQLERLQPEVILAFDDIYPPRRHHADHSRTGEAVAAILPSLKGVRAIGRFSTEAPNRIVDASATWDEKLALMRLHKSQFDTPRNGLMDRLIGRAGDNPFAFIARMVEGFAHRDGARVGLSLGEGLRWTDLRPH